MGDFLCKIWRFFLNLVEQVVNVIADAIGIIFKAAFDVLGDIVDGAAGLLEKPLTWLLAGLGLWWLLGKRNNEEEKQDGGRSPT